MFLDKQDVKIVKKPKVEEFCCQGSVIDPEDRHVIIQETGIFGVFDGYSAPYNSDKGPLMYYGNLSGGAVAAIVLEWACRKADSEFTPRQIILNANRELEKAHKQIGLSTQPGKTQRLAGASFVVAKMIPDGIRIGQGGDCLAVWRSKTGEFGATKNYAYPHVSKVKRIIKELLQKNNGDRKMMWREFGPIVEEYRAQDVNNLSSPHCLAILNGQSSLANCYQTYQIPEDVEIIMLFSDGFFEDKDTVDEFSFAESMISRYETAGICGLLRDKKARDKKNAKTSYKDADEATLIALRFN